MGSVWPVDTAGEVPTLTLPPMAPEGLGGDKQAAVPRPTASFGNKGCWPSGFWLTPRHPSSEGTLTDVAWLWHRRTLLLAVTPTPPHATQLQDAR